MKKNKECRDDKTSSITNKKCMNEHCILTIEQELERRSYKDENGLERCLYCDSLI